MTTIWTTLLVCLSLLHVSSGGFYCHPGWKMDGETCYYLSPNIRTWHQAFDYCRSKNSTLINILNAEKNAYISTLKGSNTIWTGLRASANSTHFGPFVWAGETMNGSPAVYTNWGNEEPNRGTQSCVFMYRYRQGAYGRWNDYYCNKAYPYFCEKVKGSGPCPQGWTIEYQSHCYKASSSYVDWFTARQRCQEDGGDLAVIDNINENGMLKGKLPSDRTWIGLWDRHMDNRWRWLDQPGEPSWVNWNKGEPQNNGNTLPEDCAAMYGKSYRRGRWKSAICMSYYQYICEKVAVNGTCPSGWKSRTTNSVKSCYFVSTALESWAGARAVCHQDDADLMAIETSSELYWIKSSLRGSYDDDCYWIGLSDHAKRGTWAWLDGTVRASYTNWYSSEPRGPEGEDCVMLHGTSHNLGKWVNVKCTLYIGYVCEISGPSCGVNGTYPLMFGDHCYTVRTSTTSWTSAKSRCQSVGPDVSNLAVTDSQQVSYLAVIDSQQEMAFISSLIEDHKTVGGFWIGLNARESRQIYRWLDNSTSQVTYTNWDDGQPHKRPTEDCVKISSSNWYDDSCLDKYRFACESPRLGEHTYYDFSIGNEVYKVAAERNFPRSADFNLLCSNSLGTGAHLANIDSTADFVTIGIELSVRNENFGSREYWIGNVSSSISVPRTIPGECVYLDTTFPASPRLSTSFCCAPKAALCRKFVDKSQQESDYLFNNTIYKFGTETKTYSEAEAECGRMLQSVDGKGTLMRITSDAELKMVSAEIRARHKGKELFYWVEKGPVQRFESETTTESPSPVKKCPVLSYKGYPDTVWDQVHLDVLEDNCSKSAAFVCQRVLPASAHTQIDATVLEEVQRKMTETKKLILDRMGTTPTPRVRSAGCTGACKGLAISIPFAIIIFFVLGFGIAVFFYRRGPGTGFLMMYDRKASDAVYLKTDH